MKKIFCTILVIICILSLPGCGKHEEAAAPGVAGWTLKFESERMITDGVTYLERIYKDASDSPHKAYILLIDPDKATLYTGTSDNSYNIVPIQRQNVLQHMQASVRDGVDVIAAVNGDFFAISSTFQPTGLSIKNGVTINLNYNNRPYSAVTKDGEFLISRGAADNIDPESLQMAVGGSHVIVEDGQVHDVAQQDSFGRTSAPRTLAGVKEDGTIILAVIDGRQPAFSNGATLTQCAEFMISLGAITAINHDGGGSSTMIIRDQDNYQVMNSPSDGNLRAVFCSIQVIKR